MFVSVDINTPVSEPACQRFMQQCSKPRRELMFMGDKILHKKERITFMRM